MPTATLTSKGQVTIPKEIRDRLRLKTGDRLHFWVDADGSVHLRAQNRSLLDMVGFMKHLVKRTTPVTVEEMDEAIQRAAVDRFLGKREPGE
ncbi:MAG: AbrB/MazE/SpoVT family DNA-binding domain-containing protein [Anaeromyxobacteraceae bacterium]